MFSIGEKTDFLVLEMFHPLWTKMAQHERNGEKMTHAHIHIFIHIHIHTLFTFGTFHLSYVTFYHCNNKSSQKTGNRVRTKEFETKEVSSIMIIIVII